MAANDEQAKYDNIRQQIQNGGIGTLTVKDYQWARSYETAQRKGATQGRNQPAYSDLPTGATVVQDGQQPDYDALAAQHGGRPNDTVKMIGPDGESGTLAFGDVEQARKLGWTVAPDSQIVKMIGPKGQTATFNRADVDPNYLNQARAKGWAVAPDTPDAQKMVTPGGQVTYALPDEVQQFRQSGHTLINPDGSFTLQGIRGEDPLQEAKRRQAVLRALTPQERAAANRADLSDAMSAGKDAAIATAAGVTGASAAAPIGAAVRAAAASPLGQTVISEGTKYLLRGAAAGLGWKLGGKWLGKIASGFLE